MATGELLTYRDATETQPSWRGPAVLAGADSSREPKRTRCALAIFATNAVRQATNTNHRRQENVFTATPTMNR
jgi:hypothetical protein